MSYAYFEMVEYGTEAGNNYKVSINCVIKAIVTHIIAKRNGHTICTAYLGACIRSFAAIDATSLGLKLAEETVRCLVCSQIRDIDPRVTTETAHHAVKRAASRHEIRLGDWFRFWFWLWRSLYGFARSS
jgi:hypothetical protein